MSSMLLHKIDSLQKKVKVLVFLSMIAIGIPAMLLVYNHMNREIFKRTSEMNIKWIESDIDSFSEHMVSLMDTLSWISFNYDIENKLNSSTWTTADKRDILNAQKDTLTYVSGALIGKYVNKVVVFSTTGKKYIVPMIYDGALTDVENIKESESFKEYKRHSDSNIMILSDISLSFPHDNVIVGYGRNYNNTVFVYVEVNTDVLGDMFSDHLGKDLFISDDSGWIYPYPVLPELETNSYKRIDMDIPLTPFIISYYAEKSILSIISSGSIALLMLFLLGAVFFSYIIANVLTHHITEPVSRLVKHLHYLTVTNDYGVVNTSIEEESDEIGRIGHAVNSMSISIRELLDKNAKISEEKKDTEMRLLQMQVNPHFLYNTLESIHWMAEVQHSEGIADMARGLSNLLKNISKNTDDHITLSEELELLSDYEEIQQVRYMGLFEVLDRIPEELKCYHIIKFTLQPIIENAIFHGIEPAGRDGKIILMGHKDDRFLYIDIVDNGIGMTEEEMYLMFNSNSRTRGLTGVGIRNVDERLKLTYGSECGLTYHSQKNLFTHVRVKLLLEE